MKKALADALENRGYDTLTPVQEAVSNEDVLGRDLLVSAQTGSGKTIGFGIAIAPTILGEGDAFEAAGAPLALVIAPTRELALQVKHELSWLFAGAGAVLASCVGGMDMRDERRALARGAHIVVATPGRLRDHIMRGSIDLSTLRAVVLDEADEMLDLGFRDDLEFILGSSPDDRQTLLFSATVPKSIAGLAKSYQKDALRIVTKSETSQHADIEYQALMVADRDAENAVINTLLYYKSPNAIVFGNTRVMVNRLTTRLSNRGFKVVALSGELSQAERTHALQAMRDGRAHVCVATDVAARGIDLPNLDLVVHAELPTNHETLLHRSGRTGRAGRKGTSALIITKKFRKKAERILASAKVKAEWTTAPSAEAVNAREEERMLADDTWAVPTVESEQETVDKLLAGYDASQLATAYLRLYRSVRSSPEELSDVDAAPAPRVDFGPSVWFSVEGGRAAGAEPRRLLPMLCKASDLTRDDVGAIRIQQDVSYVQVKQASAAGLVAALGPKMTVEGNAKVVQLAKPPVLDGGPRPSNKGPKKPHRKDKPHGAPSTKPVDWDDAPAPRAKKPKPQDRPDGGKPRHAKQGGGPHKSRRSETDTTAITPHKPKGPTPPKGKTSSKKNRARQQLAKGKGKGGKPGGSVAK